MNKISRDELMSIILEVLNEIGKDSDNKSLIEATSQTLLYGDNGNLDSMSLVYMVSHLEKVLSFELSTNIVLVNKRAMSQRNSPFQTVSTLIEFIEDVIKEKNI